MPVFHLKCPSLSTLPVIGWRVFVLYLLSESSYSPETPVGDLHALGELRANQIYFSALHCLAQTFAHIHTAPKNTPRKMNTEEVICNTENVLADEVVNDMFTVSWLEELISRLLEWGKTRNCWLHQYDLGITPSFHLSFFNLITYITRRTKRERQRLQSKRKNALTASLCYHFWWFPVFTGAKARWKGITKCSLKKRTKKAIHFSYQHTHLLMWVAVEKKTTTKKVRRNQRRVFGLQSCAVSNTQPRFPLHSLRSLR